VSMPLEEEVLAAVMHCMFRLCLLYFSIPGQFSCYWLVGEL
jgi:hypothetical protein